MTRLTIQRNPSRFWSAHTHSRYSHNDALPLIEDMVAQAKKLGYRGLGLTDHGNMAGAVQLYKECTKAGIKPFIGSEMYLVHDRADKKAKRYHLGLLAYTTQGYRNMVQISTRSHRQFYNKPLLDLADLADLKEQGLTEGIAVMTGCFFGMVIQTMIKDGWGAAYSLTLYLKSCFKEVFVELQRHKIDRDEWTEDEICRNMVRIATALDLSTIITQDSHYVSLGDKTDHEALKRLVAFGPEADDAVFPGSGFHLADDSWLRGHFSDQEMASGLEGLDRLLDLWDMAIPEMDEYNYRVPTVSADPLKEVSQRCYRELLRKGHYNQRYLAQLKEELQVIEASRMAGYMLMVAQICDHMREVDMFYQIRGSAAGSLVTWLLGIGNIDPLKWKLRFDRFLSKDRTKPPDIDIDVEHDRRQELIAWIGQRFTVVQIGTYGTYSIAGDSETGKGSLRVQYMKRKRMAGQSTEWKDVTKQELSELISLSDRKLVSGYGVHAAGLIVCSSRTELEAQVPLMWVASSKTLVSQYNGHDVEDIGLVKLDVLGVKTLAVLRRVLKNLGRDTKDGLEWIPLTADGKVFAPLAKGDTDGVYQLEGWTNQREMKRLRPTKVQDLIAAMALYRPGVMKSGAMETYYRRREGTEKTPKQHIVIESATKETFGILLYQEQVIDVLRQLGMPPDDLTEFLKAVKASNKNVVWAKSIMDKHLPVVHEMCTEAGMGEHDWDWLNNALAAFADYSFNRAHSTVYGLTAYYCAYLIHYYPLEFHSALLAVAASTDKEQNYQRVARRRGLRLLPPDVNRSRATYAVDPKREGIRKGLMAIKGLGPVAATEIELQQPFDSLDDFASKVNPRKVTGVKGYLATKSLEHEHLVGHFELLYDAGAFKSLGVTNAHN